MMRGRRHVLLIVFSFLFFVVPQTSTADEFTVQGLQQWQNTGVTITAGDIMNFSATGEICCHYCIDSADYKDPQGCCSREPDPYACRAIADSAWGGLVTGVWKNSLVGKIGNGTPFYIGDENTIPASASGVLYLAFNDNYYSDNAGSFTVQVTIEDTPLPVVDISGTIECNTTFHPDTVYMLTGNCTIAAGCTLHVEAGTILKFKKTPYTRLLVEGILDVQGSPGNLVYFTSSRDDSLGGDSDGALGAPGNGDWSRIEFTNGDNTLDYCEIRYAGYYYGGYYGAVYANNCTPVISDNIFRYTFTYSTHPVILCNYTTTEHDSLIITGNQIMDGGTDGIRCTGNAEYTLCRITGNTLTGVRDGVGIAAETVRSASTIDSNTIIDYKYAISTDDCSPVVSSNNISTTREDIIPRYPFRQVDGSFPTYSANVVGDTCYPAVAIEGNIDTSGTWIDVEGRGWPYVLSGDVQIEPGATLSVPAGTVVKFEYRAARLLVEGILDVQGSPGNLVYFTSSRDDSLGGDSDGALGAPGNGDWSRIQFNNGNQVLNGCEIRYAGYYYGGYYGAVYANNCTPGITNVTIEYTHASSPAIWYAYSDATPATVTGNTISGGGTYGIKYVHTGTQSSIALIASNTISGVTTAGIYISGQKLYSTVDVSGNAIDGASETTFTGIDCQNVKSGSKIQNNNVSNCGTRAIYCNDAVVGILDNNVYQTGASLNTGSGLVLDNGCQATISSNTVLGFETGILSQSGSTPPCTLSVVNNQISQNNDIGIRLESTNTGAHDGPVAVINNNDLYGNGNYDLYLGDYLNPDSRSIDALSNWWGSTDSVTIAGKIFDRGDATGSPTADFVPFLTGPIDSNAPVFSATPNSFYVELQPDGGTTRTMRINNTGVNALHYQILEAPGGPPAASGSIADRVASSPQVNLPWISAAPDSGSVSGMGYTDIQLTFTADSTEQNYYAYLVVMCNDNDNNPYVVPVTLKVSSIIVTRPNGAEPLTGGATYEIEWESYDPATVQSIDIYYSTDNGETYGAVVTGEPDDGSFDWTVPGVYSDNCLVKVVANFADLTTSEDTSDRIFSIVAVGTGVAGPSIPTEVELGQNYPNPFNPSTHIDYSVPVRQRVTLTIYDVRGRLVQTLVDETVDAGVNRVFWNGRDRSGREVASGVYFYRLSVAESAQTRKMILLR